LKNRTGKYYYIATDPFVSHPENPQGYNRYAYCLNNPLKYTDPSGYSAQTAGWQWWIDQNMSSARLEYMSNVNSYRFTDTEFSRQMQQAMNSIREYNNWADKFAMFYKFSYVNRKVIRDYTYGQVEEDVTEMIVNNIGGGHNDPDPRKGVKAATRFGYSYFRSSLPKLKTTSAFRNIDNYDETNLFGDLTFAFSCQMTMFESACEGIKDMAKIKLSFKIAGSSLGVSSLYNQFKLTNKKDNFRSWGESTRLALTAISIPLSYVPYGNIGANIFNVGDGFGVWNGYYRQIDRIQVGFNNGKIFIPRNFGLSLLTGIFVPLMKDNEKGIYIGN
jgi:hypothetical protein